LAYALDFGRDREFRLEREPEGGSVFLIRPMDGEQAARASSLRRPETTGEYVLHCLFSGLNGWKDFLNASGSPVKFQGSGPQGRASLEDINLIPLRDRQEIAMAIFDLSALPVEVKKK